MTTRPVLGLITDGIDGPYQNELFGELARAARAQAAHLLCFAGGMLEPDPSWGGPRNRVYELAATRRLDGLVVSSATLANRVGSARLSEYMARFDALPLCSIGLVLPGAASIVLDNAAGMRDVVLHLIGHHDLERIAFIEGPEANEEARQRREGYEAALRERQLHLDPALVVSGDFSTDSGVRAIRTLLDQRHASFQGVAAASDQMALGAIAELEARGLRVPGAVAVVGFDDELASAYAPRPLTTMRQPLRAQADEAVRLLLGRRAGQAPPAVSKLHTELVTRRSCGCPMQRDSFAVALPPQAADLADRRALILIELLTAAPELSGTKWADRLLDALVAQLEGQAGDSFTGALDDLAAQATAAGLDLRTLQPVISSLRRATLPALAGSTALLLQAETLLHEGRVLLANLIHHREVQRRLEVEGVARVLSGLAQALIGTSDVGSLVEALAAHLPGLGIPSAYLSLEHGADLRLWLAHDSRRSGPPRVEHAVFPMADLMPRELWTDAEPRCYVVQSLVSRDRPLGVVLFESGARDGAVYESLCALLSAALERVLRTRDRAI